MYAPSRRPSERITAVIAAAALQGALGYALIVGLAGDMPKRIEQGLKLFSIAAVPPPPPIVKPVAKRTGTPRREGASPPNLRTRPTEIVASPPLMPLPIEPVVAAPKTDAGSDPSAGAARLAGPGFASGGPGTGVGSGDAGDGDGGGGTPARWRSGRIRGDDFPPGVGDLETEVSLRTRYAVSAEGRVTECTIVRSSGNAILDETTCRLVKRRYRYKPARDARGKAIPAVVMENHGWGIE